MGFQMGFGCIHLHLERLGNGNLGQGTHDLLMAHKGIGTPVHQLCLTGIGTGRKVHPGAFFAIGIHQAQFFQCRQLQIREVCQNAAKGGGDLIAGTGSFCIRHGAHAEAVQHNYNKSLHF